MFLKKEKKEGGEEGKGKEGGEEEGVGKRRRRR